MMKYLRLYTAALFAFGIFALSAGPAPAVPVNVNLFNNGNRNLTGQYAGSVTDSVTGTGSASANFAGLGENLGGYFAFSFGTASYSNAASAQNTAHGMEGVFVATIASTACSFSFHARYSGSNNRLRGQYQAVNGCSGEHGTFSLKQQCFYNENNDIRGAAGLRPC
ncbi:MAG TPA: hypothetical protein VGG51_07755 [Candidatus Cybelea sp.]